MAAKHLTEPVVALDGVCRGMGGARVGARGESRHIKSLTEAEEFFCAAGVVFDGGVKMEGASNICWNEIESSDILE